MILDEKIWKWEKVVSVSDLKHSLKEFEEKLFHKLVLHNMELSGLILREHEKRRLIKNISKEVFGKGLI